MGRSKVKVITQHREESCGPASIKHALEIFGLRRSLTYLHDICKTNSYGTSTTAMIRALRRLGYVVLQVEHATLRHLTCALRHTPNKPRAVIVSYLYDQTDDVPEHDSGHWATVASYRASDKRIVVLDSYTGKRKSYMWDIFRGMWKDYDRIRKPISKMVKKIRLVRKWQHRLLLIVAKDKRDLPRFKISTARLYA